MKNTNLERNQLVIRSLRDHLMNIFARALNGPAGYFNDMTDQEVLDFANVRPREKRAVISYKFAEEAKVKFKLTGHAFVQGDAVIAPPIQQRKRKRAV